MDKAREQLAGVMQALRFDAPDTRVLRSIAESDWPALFRLTDAAQLTLPLAVRRRNPLPPVAAERLAQSLSDNSVRYERMLKGYSEIAQAFSDAGIEFVVLKGLAQSPWYNDDPRHRPQNDIDLWCPAASLASARLLLERLGYQTVAGAERIRADHLPVMIRKTGWKWRGNYYDPDMPQSVELHFQLWDQDTEGFAVPGIEEFRARSVVREIGGLNVPTLHPADGLTYSAMHAVRHLLRGDLQPRHVYELAHFLERSAGHDDFWKTWAAFRKPEQRRVEGIAFRFAQEWFGPRIHEAARAAIDGLPASVRRWFGLFAFSPATAAICPNKDELWLHMLLVSDARTRRRIALRRLLPTRGTRVLLDAHLPAKDISAAVRVRRVLFEMRFLMHRTGHHARAVIPVIRSGVRWWLAAA